MSPLLDALRAHIIRLEQGHAQFQQQQQKAKASPWVMGIPELDHHLPAQGLQRAGLHDVSPREYGDQPAAMGFALALALRRLADPQPTREDWESDPTLYRRRAEQKVLAAILRARGRGW